VKGLFLKIFGGLLLLILIILGGLYRSVTVAVPDFVTKADAIVLLSGNYHERAPAAALLLRAGYADRVILTNDGVFSSWSTKYNRNLSQSEWAEEELVALGVGREQIVKLPELVNSTMSEALLACRYAREKGLKRIIVVTADYHTRRALWAFRKAFETYPAELMVYPAVSKVSGVKTRVIESGKLLYYMVKYGLMG
jgi:uncharacterized SAM-binding protein YcdF (DUF218 family)